MNYIIIFLKENTKKDIIIDFLKGLLGGNIKVVEDKEILINYDFVKVDFKTITSMLIDDFGVELTLLECSGELEYVNYLIDLYYTINNKSTYLNEKTLFRLSSKFSDELVKKNILKEFYNDNEMTNIIKVFLESNLNSSVCAKKLYLHRNTLINKIDKFIKVTGYDIKKFKDAYIIYKII